jgi:hypothetical protein
MSFRSNIILLIVGLLLQIGLSLRAQNLTGITVIGNNLGLKSMSEQQTIEYFKARNNLWPSNKPVLVCLPATQSTEAVEVCSKIYGKTVTEVQKFWLAEVFKGRSRSPHFAESDEEMIEFVKKNPGAIGAFINERGLAIPQELQLQIVK